MNRFSSAQPRRSAAQHRVRSPFPSFLKRFGGATFVALLALLAQLLPNVARSAEIVRGPEVEPASTTARIRWQTDTATGTRVQYGLQPGQLPQRADGDVTSHHDITLKGLQPGTTYHFTVGTARVPLATNHFTTTGSPRAPRDPSPAGTPPSQAQAGRTSPPIKAPSVPDLPAPPPTRKTWGNLASLQDHFERHGRDFNARDADDYAAQAWTFLQRARRDGLPAKRDSDGVVRVYDPKTRAFAAYNRDGTTKTYFRPGRSNYFADQPGDPLDLKAARWP